MNHINDGKESCCGPSCCGPNDEPKKEDKESCCEPTCCDKGDEQKPEGRFKKIFSEWTREGRIGEIKCRLFNSFRMNYTVAPGLYALGQPDGKSDVFVSANYKLSFDLLRRSLKGFDAWILVLDTKGINVWCAAGEGTFGTDELVARIAEAGLQDLVDHRRIIVPQLGGPGVAAHVVKKRSGFNVHFGPVRAEDIPAYMAAKYEADKEMREVKFTFVDRLVLTPMELAPAMRAYGVFAIVTLLIFGLKPSGVVFHDAWAGGLPMLMTGLLAVLSGAFLTPLFINLLPSRSFAVKGFISGIVILLAASSFLGVHEIARPLQAFSLVFFPLASSYLALQFTGSTVFTGISGVKKELKYALPIYIFGLVVSCALIIAFKLGEFGLI